MIRHGQAKPKDQDPERGLTDEGRREVAVVAALVAAQAASIRHIWHSGKKRAAETAEILRLRLRQAGARPECLVHPGLSPEDPVDPLAAELAELADDVAIVGHLPFLDRLASRLVAPESSPPLGVAAFEAGSIMCLGRIEGAWLLAWFVTPALAAGRGGAPGGDESPS